MLMASLARFFMFTLAFVSLFMRVLQLPNRIRSNDTHNNFDRNKFGVNTSLYIFDF
jgi:hypothetical protein